MTIIGISGWAGSGKDTVGQILVEDHGFTRVAFADKLKALALELNPPLNIGSAVHIPLDALVSDFGTLDNAKLKVPAVREYLQKLGVAARHHLFEDVWVKAALRSAAFDDENVVVTDVRFKNEAVAISRGRGLVWRVTRPGVYPVNGHVSEHDLDGFDFDAYLNNDGTIDDLRVLVAALVNTEVPA